MLVIWPALVAFVFSSSSLGSPSPPGGEHWRDAQQWSHGPSASSPSAFPSVEPAAWYDESSSAIPSYLQQASHPAQHPPWALLHPTYDASSGSSQRRAYESNDYGFMYGHLPGSELPSEPSGQQPFHPGGVESPQSHWQRNSRHNNYWPEGSQKDFLTQASMIPHAGGQSLQSLDIALRRSQDNGRQQQQQLELEQLRQFQNQSQQHQQQWTQSNKHGATGADLSTSNSSPDLSLDVDHLGSRMHGQQLSLPLPSPSPQQQQRQEDELDRRHREAEEAHRIREKSRKLRAQVKKKMAIDPERAEWLEARAARWQWKAHLKRGSLKAAYDNYFRHTEMKEATARKHIDFVENIRLVEELMSADEDTSRNAALTIFEMNNILNHKHTISETKRLLCKSFNRVVSDFTGIVGKSYSTTVRRLEETLTPDIARLLREDETYQEGFEALTHAYQEANEIGQTRKEET